MSLKRDRKLSLHFVLVAPFVLQTFMAVGIVGYLSYKNGEKAVNDLADQVIVKTEEVVDQHLDNYLETPWQALNLTLEEIKAKRLNIYDLEESGRHYWRQAKIFKQLSFNGHFLANGEGAGAGQWVPEVGLLRTEQSERTQGRIYDYLTNQNGDRTQRLLASDYNALEDDWYKALQKARKPIWARSYAATTNFEFDINAKGEVKQRGQKAAEQLSAYIAVSAAAPIFDQQGNLVGGLNIDLLIDAISHFLHNLKVTPSSQIFIMEDDGVLVANSKLQLNYKRVKNQVERINGRDSQEPLIRAATQFLQQKTELRRIQERQTFRDFWHDGKPHFLHVVPRRDERGLNWLIAIAIPESDFMQQIHANTRMTITACLVALLSAIALGFFTSRWLIQPILEVNRATERMASGVLDQAVPGSSIRELETLSNSFNHMAKQLRDSFALLETRVTERTFELSNALQHLQQTQAQLIQQEKMSSLGEMVGGIAHEINNPVSFIHGNLNYTEQYSQDLVELLNLYQQHFPNPPEAIQAKIEDIDLEFLIEDLDKMLSSMKTGTHRIQSIVLSLRNFSRLDEAEFKPVNIHEGIDSTLMILQNRLTLQPNSVRIEVISNYAELPKVECYAGQLNQVFMNLLVNAIDALEEAVQKNPAFIPQIHITTERIENWVKITIADNGSDIPASIQAKIFDPFFTTKPVGKGTGLGLSVSYQIITERHNGKLYFEPGSGAKFAIELPIHQF